MAAEAISLANSTGGKGQMKLRLNQANFLDGINSVLTLTLAELKHNIVSFLFPGLFYGGLLIYILITGERQLHLFGTWTVLILAVLFAMVYGLQCFSSEVDQKTLDFILTRPLSLYLITGVKYLTSLAVLAGWIIVFTETVHLTLASLPLVEGMGPAWLLLIILTVHSISCCSGLLAKGLERLFGVTVMTGSLALLSYHLWSLVFDLIKANYFWFDIPLYQINFLKTILPVYLAGLCLATPLLLTVWFLHGRIPIYLFKPGRWLIGIWMATYLLTGAFHLLLAPPLWPDSTALSGDWHETGGIILSGPVQEDDSFRKPQPHQKIPCRITLAKLGRKSRPIYSGFNIQRPRFAPDGTRIAFAEDGIIKILNLKNNRLTIIGPGHTAAWSNDGDQLLCAESVPNSSTSRFYRFNLKTGKKSYLTERLFKLVDFTWNSRDNVIYYLGYRDELGFFNPQTQAIKEFRPGSDREKPLNYYGIISPTLIYVKELNQVIWGQVFEDELRIFGLDSSGTIKLLENLVSPRLKTAAPVIINNQFKAFIWQRIDGTFVLQATKYYSYKDDHHEHENGHESQPNSGHSSSPFSGYRH